MNVRKPSAGFPRLILGIVVCAFMAPIAWAKAPDPLQAAIRHGHHLFATGTFGGNGLTCQSCHTDGGMGPGRMANGHVFPSLANAAAIFPRFSPRAGRVVTLEDQVRACIAGALGGKPVKSGSLDMTDLVSYLTSLSSGKPIDMGGKPK